MSFTRSQVVFSSRHALLYRRLSPCQESCICPTHGVDFPAPLWSKKTTYKIQKKGGTRSIIRRLLWWWEESKSLLDTLYLFGLKKQRSFSSHPPPGPPPCRGLSKVAFIRNERCTRPHHEGRRLFDIHYHDKSIDCCQRGSRRGVAGAGMKRTWGTVSIS